MNQLQIREKEIFETFKKIKSYSFVVIGGYAVNSYALPSFSVDCDIVVKDTQEANNIEKSLFSIGYKKEEASKTGTPYMGEFRRYEKTIQEGFKVSMDVLITKIFDRQTDVVFDADWVFDNAKKRKLQGKTITEEVEVKIINVDALVVMKVICGCNTDIRDVFMMVPKIQNELWIKEEITKRHDIKKVKERLQKKIDVHFRNNLQGVFGYIHDEAFNEHKKRIKKLFEPKS